MSLDIKKIAVIGAGTMGAQLAALFAGASCGVELLDIVPPDAAGSASQAARDRLAIEAMARMAKASPPLLFSRADLAMIRPGNIEDHLDRLHDCDWVIESVTERLDIKAAIFAQIEHAINPSAIVSSNTSGISLKQLLSGRCAQFSRRFFISHFFNPPRHLKLVEFVAGAETDEDALSAAECFLSMRLGKGVVRAKDTPAFIANRIGAFYALDVMHLVSENGWPIEAVDAVLGRPSARPRQGPFRLMDMVGLDTVAFVAEGIFKGCQDDESVGRFRIPQFLQHLMVKGWVGDKSGRGFYWKDKGSGSIHALDPCSLDYRPRISFYTPALEEAGHLHDARERLRKTVFAGDHAEEIAWPCISRTLVYAANRVPGITEDFADVDRSMRWGYNWELGPFEAWDALGVERVAERLSAEGRKVPAVVQKLLSSGSVSFYRDSAARDIFVDMGAREDTREEPDAQPSLFALNQKRSLVEENESASLIDSGDGFFICEFRSRMNAIDEPTLAMLDSSLSRVEREGAGLMITSRGEHFSNGANLALLLSAAKAGRYDHIESMVIALQSMCQRIRFSRKPVVAVPFGRTLGGGCELSLSAGARVPHIESYAGLVEISAGLVPAGGGCKNLLLMMQEGERQKRKEMPRLWESPGDGGPMPAAARAFETIATARVSGSAREAVELGFFSGNDPIVYDRDELCRVARSVLVNMARDYSPPTYRNDIPVAGRGGAMSMVNAARGFVARGRATEFDALIAGKVAHVLSGGDLPCNHLTSEQHLLDLEREAFLSLIGEERTQRRIEKMLTKKKSPRN